jgi:hypothetical protein
VTRADVFVGYLPGQPKPSLKRLTKGNLAFKNKNQQETRQLASYLHSYILLFIQLVMRCQAFPFTYEKQTIIKSKK